MGQILSTGAIIKSGLFTNFPENDQKELVQILINAGKQRSFLSLASYSFLISLVEIVRIFTLLTNSTHFQFFIGRISISKQS